jgi:hypothetical protein
MIADSSLLETERTQIFMKSYKAINVYVEISVEIIQLLDLSEI